MIPSATRLVTRSSGLRLAMVSIGASSLAVVAAMALSSSVSAADPLMVQVGVGEGTVAGQAYLPGRFTVEAGQSVTFRVATDEPHSVTFGEGPKDVSPDAWPVSGWAAPTVQPPTPTDLGAANYDGTGFLNTGLMSRGSSATATFTTPGVYEFTDVLHPGMSGEVDVVEAGAGGATTQADADAAAKVTSDFLLGQVDSTRQARLDGVESIRNADGTSTWNIFADASTVAGPLPGGGTGYLELYEMVPTDLAIGVGDTVHWSAVGVQTVAFPATGQDPATIDPFGPPAGTEIYDGTSYYNSGVLNAGPGAPSAYTLMFPSAGIFPYVSPLHQSQGQSGVIAVGRPLPSAAPPASVAPAAPSASPAG